MRLINADSIKFRPYYDEYVDYDGYINDLKTWQLDDILSDRVDNTPTVNAIPVDWLRMWFTKEASLIGLVLMGEIESAWEKENGIEESTRNI